MATSTRVQENNQVGSAEVYFAKKLANNDKKVRDKAFVKLKLWLISKVKTNDGLTHTELLKIWKGLFYCMWFSDKVLVQEELATSLANLIHIFDNSSLHAGLLFSKVFFITIGREWIGIDRLRLDKFYFLIKRFIHETLKYLQNSEWNSEIVSEYSTFITEFFLEQKYPDGLKIYLTENTFPELSFLMEDNNKIPKEDAMLLILEPFLSGAAYTLSNSVLNVVKNEVLEKIIKDELVKDLKIPLKLLANRLNILGSAKEVKTKNRKILYLYAKKFNERDDFEVNKKNATKNKRKKKIKTLESVNKKKKTSETETSSEVDLRNMKKKKKKKKMHRIETSNVELNNNLTVLNEKSSLEKIADQTINQNISDSAETVKDSIIQNAFAKVANCNSPNISSPALQIDSDIKSSISCNLTCHSDDTVKQKLDFTLLSTENVALENSCETPSKIRNTSNVKAEIKADVPEEQVFHVSDQPFEKVEETTEKLTINVNSTETKITPDKKQRRSLRKKTNDKDSPKPLVTFIKTPAPKAFVNSRQMRTVPGKVKKEAANINTTDFTTPQPEKRRVRIELSKNMAVGHKELKISPLPAFNPALQPNKSAMKVYSTRSRAKASDFM